MCFGVSSRYGGRELQQCNLKGGIVGSSCSYGGDQRPTMAEVSANLRAGAEWAGKRDVPDTDAWADFNAAPDLVHQRLTSRVKEDRCPSVAHTFPIPKPGTNEVRWMAWLNPYDDLYLRIVAGRVATAIDTALGRDVFSYRLADKPPGWSAKSRKQSFELRRDRGRELLADERCDALGVADVRHYYPSIAPDVLMDALCQIASPRGAAGLISSFVRELSPMGTPTGLPIGPEASGLLGNIVLRGVDKAIACHTRGHVRYTDDSWMFLHAESEWPEVYEIYVSALSDLGLEVNTSKVAIHPKGSDGAENAIQHIHIAYLTSPGARDRTPERSVEEIREELDQEQPDWNIIGFHLGSLRSAKRACGLVLLYEHPEILNELPQKAGQYLSALAGSKKSRKQIDRDWLVEQATASPTDRSSAGQLHVCRVASQLRLGNEHGKRLEQFATDSSLRHHAPLQAWAAKAWGSSKAHAPGPAVDYACHFGDFSVRRAFALTVSPAASTPFNRSCWRRKLRSIDPDLEPTLARLD